MAFNVQDEIDKLLNSLKPKENDVNKIAKVVHRSLLIMSVRDAVIEMREKKKEEEGEAEGEKNDENDEKLFHELIQKSYLEKLDFIKKNTVKLSLSYSF